jgi:hypothetical protein
VEFGPGCEGYKDLMLLSLQDSFEFDFMLTLPFYYFHIQLALFRQRKVLGFLIENLSRTVDVRRSAATTKLVAVPQ